MEAMVQKYLIFALVIGVSIHVSADPAIWSLEKLLAGIQQKITLLEYKSDRRTKTEDASLAALKSKLQTEASKISLQRMKAPGDFTSSDGALTRANASKIIAPRSMDTLLSTVK